MSGLIHLGQILNPMKPMWWLRGVKFSLTKWWSCFCGCRILVNTKITLVPSEDQRWTVDQQNCWLTGFTLEPTPLFSLEENHTEKTVSYCMCFRTEPVQGFSEMHYLAFWVYVWEVIYKYKTNFPLCTTGISFHCKVLIWATAQRWVGG